SWRASLPIPARSPTCPIMDLPTAQLLWTAAGGCFTLAALALLLEHRRRRRRDIDRPGLVDWNAVQLLAFTLAVLSAALALKA
ncbi:MAG: hypothetical protein QOJ94_2701, partial [Sphingomonadales bacterium]|nr:hypothetical protein [Sphingomonadales bacterium]